MTALQELEELRHIMCGHYLKHESNCTDCPFHKEGCMISREIVWIKQKENREHGTA